VSDEIQQADEEYVEGVIRQLRMRFDAVQVFVTRDEPDQKTLAFSTGAGNWYARYGQVVEWLENGGEMHITEVDEEEDE
jgi:hypothetical protein